MTNIFKTPEKRDRKKELLEIGLETLEKEGWTVAREKGLGKSSVRRVTKNGESKLVSIRTTQDRWLAFAPKPNGKGWNTLDDVDVVIAVSPSPKSRREAWIHWLPADEMRGRYDRAYKARKAAGRKLPTNRGLWIPLYGREDDSDNVSYVGGGAGLDHEPIARVALQGGATAAPTNGSNGRGQDGDFLTIAAAKRGLSLSLGVPESSIKITVEA